MTTVVGQEFVVHLFAPLEGPHAAEAAHALRAVWQDCRRQFNMNEPVPGTWLPDVPPTVFEGFEEADGGERTLAAQRHHTLGLQAVLRSHHDVLNLSVWCAAPAAAEAAPEPWTWWRDLDRRWSRIVDPYAPHLLGEGRLYFARLDAGPVSADPALYEELKGLLPDSAHGLPSAGVASPEGFALWETAPEPDDRALRRFVVAMTAEADGAASAWAWSDRGGTELPPLARYLLHAAKLRYQLRVWRRDSRSRALRATLDSLSARIRERRAAPGAEGERSTEQWAEQLAERLADARILRSELDTLRRTVDIAADNLGRAFDLTDLLVPRGPFTDDGALARSMLERLDDELGYLSAAIDKAEQSAPAKTAKTETAMRADTPSTEPARNSAEHARNVFVVHGRDEFARREMFAFLRSVGLNPLEWPSLRAKGGNASPFLTEVIREGLAIAQAVVVLMTPDDIVRLHPDLFKPRGEGTGETLPSMQARPNVLIELGMALITHPTGTLLLRLGEHRTISDIDGLNYIDLNESQSCRQNIVSGLIAAGCPVDTMGSDWLNEGDFKSMVARIRRP
ncbi:CATRA conflict system CASPASE/TPR repeat-associated protein [Streptomyces sp. MS06]|uniref:CATRA conflict system CASPASE/TPR repeat-associated protein n=1 Tax=Streptomyces sp. MS06 TaxID=3385974 RepID=UPI0039A3E6BC